MSPQEFAEQSQRLTKAFGEKGFSEERLQMLWKKLKWRHAQVFSEAIDMLIVDSTQSPNWGKISEAINTAQRNNPTLTSDPYKHFRDELQKRIDMKEQCHRCQNTGVIGAYRKYQKNQPTILLCSCYSGNIAQSLPEYKHDRVIEAHDPFYLIFDFDPSRFKKMELYQDLDIPSGAHYPDYIAPIYYEKEIHISPALWWPPGHEREVKKVEPEKLSFADNETKKQIETYASSLREHINENEEEYFD